MYKIDLNSDLGESFGRYTLGMDNRIIPLISSANVACGYHASDPVVMEKTVAMAKEAGIGIGAHPGYPESGCDSGGSQGLHALSAGCAGWFLPGKRGEDAARQAPRRPV